MQSIAVKISSPKPLLYRGFFFARSGFVCSHAARDGAAGDSTLASPFSFSQWTACELSLSVQGNSLSGDHLLFRRQKVLLQRAADPGSFGQLSRMGVLLLLEMLLRSGYVTRIRLGRSSTGVDTPTRGSRHGDTAGYVLDRVWVRPDPNQPDFLLNRRFLFTRLYPPTVDFPYLDDFHGSTVRQWRATATATSGGVRRQPATDSMARKGKTVSQSQPTSCGSGGSGSAASIAQPLCLRLSCLCLSSYHF
ncbi:uncharacterized protein LOC116261838 isoform X1 [Nymphaea colorata]|nr:uncharacterized protein LOC116261838 isoform X1 [Nymphaea colorata]